MLAENFEQMIPDFLAEKNKMSWQDMKSIKRSFNEYHGINIKQDENVNNIILAQACRHSIVHDGGIVNRKVINQVQNATPRSVKEEFEKNKQISFNTHEIDIVKNSILIYLKNLKILLTN